MRSFTISIIIALTLVCFALHSYAQPASVWEKHVNGTRSGGIFNDMVLDNSGNVCVTGYVYDSTAQGNQNMFTAKYAPSGAAIWTAKYNGAASNSVDAGNAICVDDSGNVYVAGESQEASGQNCIVIKFSPTGSILWKVLYHATSYDYGYAIAIDGSHNVYVTGKTGYSNGTGMLVLKCYAAGGLAWSQAMGYGPNSNGNYSGSGQKIMVAPSGNVYAASSHTVGFNNFPVAYVTKYSNGGTQQWNQYFGNSHGANYAAMVGMALDVSENVYIGASCEASGTTHYGIGMGEISSSGSFVGASVNVAPNDNNGASDMVFSNGIYLVGNVYAVTGGNGNYYASLSYYSSYTASWQVWYDSSALAQIYAQKVAADGHGNIYMLATNSNHTTGVTSLNIVKYTSGVKQWVASKVLTSNNTFTGLKVDNAGNNFYLSGSYGGSNSAYLERFSIPQPDILIDSVSTSRLCAGSNLMVYHHTQLFHPTGNFAVQLSDANGSFSAPVVLKIYPADSTGIDTVLIPLSVTAGSGYRVRIVDSTNSVTGSDNGSNIYIGAPNTGTLNVSICPGRSYYFNGANRNATGSYLDTLVNASGCDSILTLNLTVLQAATSSINQSICQGQSYLGHSTNGTFVDTLHNVAHNGCDSIRTLNLTILQPATSVIAQSVCAGQSYLGHSTNGTFIDTLHNAAHNGCDSIRTLNLTILQPAASVIAQSVCAGQSYLGHSTNGIFIDTLPGAAANGCDSIRTLNLTVLQPATSAIAQSICQGQSYLGHSTNGTFIDTLHNVAHNGCDSIRTLNLTILQPATSVIAQSICAGQSYLGHSTNGTFVDTLHNAAANGCDSIRTLNLSILQPATSAIAQSICAGQSYLGHSTNGTFIDTLHGAAANGCDSIRILNLTVLQPAASTISQSICAGQSYLGYDSTGIFIDTLHNAAANGCDSIRTLNLTILQPATSHINHSVCAGQSYLGYDSTGIFTDTLHNAAANGCDSIRTLNLTVISAIADTITASICAGYAYGSYTTSGTYIDTFTAVGGCDSIRTLVLSVKTVAYDTSSPTICHGLSFEGHGSSAVFNDTLIYSGGCDSVIRTVHLTVTPPLQDSISQSICSGNSYSFFGQALTQAGVYKDTTQTPGGCDSIVTLNLAVNPLPAAPTITRLGNSLVSSIADRYQWYADTTLLPADTSRSIIPIVIDSGLYTVEVFDSNGCSSFSSPFNFVLGIETFNSTIGIKAIPNPATDEVMLSLYNMVYGRYDLQVYDVTGRLISNQKLVNQNTVLNISNWAGGIYLLKISDNKGNSLNTRLVKE